MQSAASSVGKFRLKTIPTWKPERSILTKTSQTGNGKFDRGEQQAIIPYGVGRNYTPVKPVRCVLLKAPCREQNDFRRFSVCPNHYRGRYTSPALAAASYPFVDLPPGNTLRRKLFPSSKFTIHLFQKVTSHSIIAVT